MTKSKTKVHSFRPAVRGTFGSTAKVRVDGRRSRLAYLPTLNDGKQVETVDTSDVERAVRKVRR